MNISEVVFAKHIVMTQTFKILISSSKQAIFSIPHILGRMIRSGRTSALKLHSDLDTL
jgi:hypothetical protein